MCKQNREFFQLPDHVKRSVAHPPRANPNRGWVCAGQERSDNITDFEKGVKERANKDGIFDLKVSLPSHGGGDPRLVRLTPFLTSLSLSLHTSEA